jgi:DNA uptake protein ComE-like DNA-binding protein
VKQAGLEDLQAVNGISGEIAKRIYAHFHPQ